MRLRCDSGPGRCCALGDKIGDNGPEALCRDNVDRLCRRILLEIIRQKTISDDPEEFDAASPYKFGAAAVVTAGRPKNKKDDATVVAARAVADKDQQQALSEKALSLYLALPNWDRGPYAVELAQAAADSAQRMGAPTFGGNILAAVAPMVPRLLCVGAHTIMGMPHILAYSK